MTETILIVGAGHAGVQLADSLRDEGFRGRIALIGEEREQPYQRPPLTKDFLHGRAASAGLLPLRAAGLYHSRGIDLLLGRRVLRIDRDAGRVVLDDASAVRYDQLVLATGARGRPHPASDPNDAAVHTIRNAEQALRFGLGLETARSLVIVGAGFVGLEVAAAARTRGVEVTIVAKDRPLSRLATPILSDFLLDAHRVRGCRFVLDQVESIEGSRGSRGGTVTTRSGTRVAADLILVAIGAQPNAELANEAGLATSNGIDVDEYSRTSDERIWAIGDVAARPSPKGVRARVESVQSATHQARCLARTLTGQPTVCTETSWFWSQQGDLRLQIAGTPVQPADTVVRGKPEGERFSVFSFVDERLAAVESVNSPRDHLAARRILSSGADLGVDQAANPSFDLKAYSLEVAASSKAPSNPLLLTRGVSR